MKSNNSTEAFYREVIIKVLDQSREYFAQANVNDEILSELKKLWHDKLSSSGIFAPTHRNGNSFFTRNYPINHEGNFGGYNKEETYGNNFLRKYLFFIRRI